MFNLTKKSRNVDPKNIFYFTLKKENTFIILDKENATLFTVDFESKVDNGYQVTEERVTNWVKSLDACFALSKEHQYAIFDKRGLMLDSNYEDGFEEDLTKAVQSVYQ